MHRDDHLDSLDLDNNEVLNEQVNAVTPWKGEVLVSNGYLKLPLETEATLAKLVGQTLFIDGLQQTWSKSTVNLDCCANDTLRNGVYGFKGNLTHQCCCSRPRATTLANPTVSVLL